MASISTHFRDILKPVSRAKYLVWRGLGAQNAITIDLKSGPRLRIRSGAATDYGVAYDIFLKECYRSPEPIAHVEQIVDLGSNVGYSCLFWCQQYPNARVTAYEPHPQHQSAIAENLSINSISDRVQLVAAAAGVAEATACLSDAGSSSSLSSNSGGYPVPVVDIFDRLNGHIDILKIDIEGGEYELLADPRFGSLSTRAVVVEWHQKPDLPDAREWCRARLKDHGYRTALGTEDLPMAGLIWGFRENLTQDDKADLS